MKALGTIKAGKTPIDGKKIIAIDPSVNSLAFAVYEGKGTNIVLIAIGKITFPRHSEVSERAKVINASITELVKRYSPTKIVIEETIYIQNPNTSRQLAYVVGQIWGKAIDLGISVVDVGPLKWKAYIGYKNVRKTEIAEWTAEIGATAAKKKAAFERKDRVRHIMFQKFPSVDEEDTDIWDAIAIGYWAINET